jgi:hypothetical protein
VKPYRGAEMTVGQITTFLRHLNALAERCQQKIKRFESGDPKARILVPMYSENRALQAAIAVMTELREQAEREGRTGKVISPLR